MNKKGTVPFLFNFIFCIISPLLETIHIGGDNMTSKELMYVEDALGHEKFMKTSSLQTSNQVQDPVLSNYLSQLEKTHNEIYTKFLNLL